MASGEQELLIDLECGPPSLQEAGRQTWSSALTYTAIMNAGTDTHTDASATLDVSHLSNVVIAIDKLSAVEETGEVKDVDPLEKKKKKGNTKKSSKPPRPPKGPVLTASDLKLVKELTELAARKRARIERIRALRKLKEAKRASSSNSSSSGMAAMLMTALFFLVLIFQGAFSGSNVRKELVTSLEAATLKEGLVQFQLLDNAYTNDEMNQQHSSSLPFSSTSELPSSLNPRKQGVDAR